MKRVIRSLAHIPINSTEQCLEWITESEIQEKDILIIHNSSDLNPIFIYPFTGIFTLIPDDWDFPYLTPTFPGIVRETRLIAGSLFFILRS